MMDTSNYMLGRYIAVAVNDPKKYPRQPASQRANLEEEDGEQMTEEDEARINALMGAFAKKADKIPTGKAEDKTITAKEPENVGNK